MANLTPDPNLHSIYGRKLGVDHDGYFSGEKGNRAPVTDATSATTADTIPQSGLTNITATTLSTPVYELEAPIAGARKTIAFLGTSTGNKYVKLASGNFQSTAGSSFTTASFASPWQVIDLLGLSTGMYQVLSNTSCGTHHIHINHKS